jgi:PKD repeat protein
MLDHQILRLLIAGVVILISAGFLRAQESESPIPDHRIHAASEHTIQVSHDDTEAQALFASAQDAVLWSERYETFTIARVSEAAWPGGRTALLDGRIRLRDELDFVALQGRRLDLRNPEALIASLDPRERLSGGGSLDHSAGLYLVALRAAPRDRWLFELEAAGARIVQYLPMNAYVVAIAPAEVSRVEDLARRAEFIRWMGVYEPAFRLRDEIARAADEGAGVPMPMTIQLVAGPRAAASLQSIASLAARVHRIVPVGPYLNLGLDLDPAFVRSVARDPAVFAIEALRERRRFDETQGQIVAGNVSGTVPNGPGYLAWLAGKGFGSGQFTAFSINVVDDSANLNGHPDLPSARVAFNNNPTSQGANQEGHGFLNAHIIAGFNDQTGGLYEDASGYQYGLGIAPWARVGSTAIFGPNFSPTSSNWENTAYGQGARISSNSWGFVNSFDYDSSAQEIDFLVRDARSGVGGNQEMSFIWAAGNDGSSSNTVGSPGTAKNCLSVGASENFRQTGTDGCAVGNSGANNVNQVINFSSRGPVNAGGGDGRWKPEIVAPGTHIQAGVPQSNYLGTGICDAFWPQGGQTLYGWSSGTSHATPAVAGGAALLRQRAINDGRALPSPALTKATLVGTATYMGGPNGVGGTLPSNTQGMGRMDLGRTFDGTSVTTIDQSVVLGASGQSHVLNTNIADPSKPLRVVLCWTDAPGATTGAPYVNDLDLVVTVGGNTYRGNVFNGANSSPGGTSDFRNNTESVFLAPGLSGPVTVTITAAAIGGNGVPGNSDNTDQDFALYVYNAGSGGGGPSGLSDGSFESQSAGGFPATPWIITSGSAHAILPIAATSADNGFPSDGSQWLEVSAAGSNNASAPSNPGGPGAGPSGASTISQIFSYPAGDTQLSFEAAFIRNENANETTYNDFMSVDVSDGLSTVNLFYADTFTASPNTSLRHNLPMTALQAVSADLALLFPGSGSTTVFTLSISIGNATDGAQSSFGFVDNFRLDAPAALISSDFSATPTSGSAPLTVNFSPITSGTVSTYFWAFGDGTISVAPAPSHVYSTPGSYDVTLTVTGPDGSAVETKSSYIVVTAPSPTADFNASPTSGNAPLVVNFNAVTTGAVTAYAWQFGDGAVSTLANPTHTYTASGNFDVTLTVIGPNGSDTITKPSFISVASTPAPVADFTATPTSGTAPLTVAFNNQSTGAANSYLWSFGDGATSFAANPSHTYLAPGSYTVTLAATGPGGTDTETKTNFISVSSLPAPVANFTATPTSGTSPLNVSFTDQSSGTISSRQWNFGDGATSAATSPSHLYTSPGNYTVSLTTTGPGGSDTETKTNLIAVSLPGGISADFGVSATAVDLGAPVSFNNLSSGGATSFLWDFGDGTTSTAANPSHLYALGGSFTVTLTATGPAGSDTETKSAFVQVRNLLSDDDYYLSFDAPTSVPGLGVVPPEDVVKFDMATGTWTLFIDGSDLGLAGNNITAFHNFGNDACIFAIEQTQVVPTVIFADSSQIITPNDLIYFLPQSTGANTTGFMYFVFDGSDVGLDGPDEAIDGVYHDGVQFLALSTKGTTFTPTTGVTQGEDVLAFDVQSFLFLTAGIFFPALDGSDLGLSTSGENINALHFDLSLGMSFSTEGALSAGGISGDADDTSRFVGAFGSATSGTLSRQLNWQFMGLAAGTNISAMSIVQQ